MTANPLLSPLALSEALLARARLDLVISDADPESRGAVIQPDELPRLGCRFAPLRTNKAIRIEVDTLGEGDHRIQRECIGFVRGIGIDGGDVLELVRYMLGIGTRPEWVTQGRVASEVYCLLIERAATYCEAHQNTGHRAGWVTRLWLAEPGSSAVGATHV